jgi:hypothetical protein
MTRALVLLVGLVIAAAPAAAGKPDHAGKGGGPGKREHKAGKVETSRIELEPKARKDEREVVFSVDHRDRVRVYYGDHYGRGHCPPGLAKKNNGCLPPGIAKKRYAIGRPLPGGVVIVPLPSDLSRVLGPPAYGYRYGLVDGDVVKLAVGSMLVVDAIDGLSD